MVTVRLDGDGHDFMIWICLMAFWYGWLGRYYFSRLLSYIQVAAVLMASESCPHVFLTISFLSLSSFPSTSLISHRLGALGWQEFCPGRWALEAPPLTLYLSVETPL